ncbi:MAG TPA: sensor histidine kinase [Actinomycetota bacterium]|nr:sensor histidine kinase [Actinomycetota bacterium]
MEGEGVWAALRRVDRRIWDALLALLVLGGTVLATQLPPQPADARDWDLLGFVLIVAATVPLAWRRRAPLIVAYVIVVADSALSLLDYGTEVGVGVAIALYTAAAYEERRRLIPVLVPLAVIAGVPVALERGNWVEVLLTVTFFAGIPIALGRNVYNRRLRIARDREVAAREAVAAERSRIARELHDVVAHHMSVMVVQAGAARAVAGRDPEAEAEALRRIEVSGRAGLTEMRRLLDILKSDERDERAPQPGLAQLDELLAVMRATGLPVEAVVEGAPHPLPPGVDLSAYRIVQEALTNTLKHAGEAHARVLLRYEPDAIEIEVADDGRGAPTASADGGQGLIGMRERVQLFGGTLESGPRPGGGFVVRARLPVLEETPA